MSRVALTRWYLKTTAESAARGEPPLPASGYIFPKVSSKGRLFQWLIRIDTLPSYSKGMGSMTRSQSPMRAYYPLDAIDIDNDRFRCYGREPRAGRPTAVQAFQIGGGGGGIGILTTGTPHPIFGYCYMLSSTPWQKTLHDTYMYRSTAC
jgi:hypothetical protein